jgi:hypothetical protein
MLRMEPSRDQAAGRSSTLLRFCKRWVSRLQAIQSRTRKSCTRNLQALRTKLLHLWAFPARLQAAKAGQPNGDMNGPALVQQIKYVKGLQQGVLDKSSAYQAYLSQNGGNTANIGQFETQFNKAFNPDVSYVRSLSNPADQQAEIAKLKQTGKYQDWRNSYVEMKKLGAF